VGVRVCVCMCTCVRVCEGERVKEYVCVRKRERGVTIFKATAAAVVLFSSPQSVAVWYSV